MQFSKTALSFLNAKLRCMLAGDAGGALKTSHIAYTIVYKQEAVSPYCMRANDCKQIIIM